MVDLSSLVPSKTRVREALIAVGVFGGLAGITKAQSLSDASVRRRALEADVVSFDVFDTAIVRALAAPVDLFGFLGEPFAAFRDARREAELAARVQASGEGRDEVTLREIHSQANWPAAEESVGAGAESLVAAEIDLEHRFCRTHSPALDLFEELKAAGRPPVFISDTSLDRSQMVDLLAGCGFHGWAEVIVSSEHGRTKRDGALFDVAAEHLGEPRNWLHLGDTLTPDVISARRRGIRAVYVPRPIDQLRLIAPRLEGRLGRSFDDPGVVSVVVGLLANSFVLNRQANRTSLEQDLERLAAGLAEGVSGGPSRRLVEDLQDLVELTSEQRRRLGSAIRTVNRR